MMCMTNELHANCVPREEFERVIAELNEIRTIVHSQQSRIEELEARLAMYEGPHAPPSARHERYPKREPTGNPVGKPKGSHGATRKLEHQTPDETIPIKPKECRRCKHPLGEPARWERHLVLDVPEPQPARLLEFRKGICICHNCGAETAAADPRLPAKGEFSPRTLALVNDLRFRERFSVPMVRAFLRERHGMDVSTASILDMTSRAASSLRGAHNGIVMRIRSSQSVHVDETGFYLNGKRIWCWIFVTDKDVLFVIRDSRGSGVPIQILGKDYRGTVVCDCFSAYDLLKKHLTKARIQKCWAHLLRESKRCSQESEEGKALHSELKAFFNRMKAFLLTKPAADSRTAEYEAALKWLDKLLVQDAKELRVARLLKRLEKHRQDWFTCIAIPDVEPTNNNAERGLRPQVILRRLRGSLRSEQGKEDHEAMTSLMMSWQLQGLNPGLQMENELCKVFAESHPP